MKSTILLVLLGCLCMTQNLVKGDNAPVRHMHVAPEVGEVGVTEEPTTEKVEVTEKENKDAEMLDRDQWQPSRNMSKEEHRETAGLGYRQYKLMKETMTSYTQILAANYRKQMTIEEIRNIQWQMSDVMYTYPQAWKMLQSAKNRYKEAVTKLDTI